MELELYLTETKHLGPKTLPSERQKIAAIYNCTDGHKFSSFQTNSLGQLATGKKVAKANVTVPKWHPLH